MDNSKEIKAYIGGLLHTTQALTEIEACNTPDGGVAFAGKKILDEPTETSFQLSNKYKVRGKLKEIHVALIYEDFAIEADDDAEL